MEDIDVPKRLTGLRKHFDSSLKLPVQIRMLELQNQFDLTNPSEDVLHNIEHGMMILLIIFV